MVPPEVHAFLQAFRRTPEYSDLQAEYVYLRDYRAAWQSAPFAPVFVTTEAP